MKSLVFWYEPKEENDSSISNAELQLHFNHWKLEEKNNSRKDYDYFLDIGIRVKDGANIRNICFFLPEVANDLSLVFEDLGSKLKDAKLLTAIFNEKYSANSGGIQKYFQATKDGKNELFIYALDVRSDLVSIHNYGGTIVKIAFTCFDGVDTYYRIRLKTDFVKKFSHIYRPTNSFFENIFSRVELIDFRVNDTRDINPSLLEHINIYGKMFNISLIHLFIMRNITDEYILSDIHLNSVRLLEEGTWNAYLEGTNYEYSKSLAYHLKTKVLDSDRLKDKYIEDFNALVKFNFEDSQLMKYLGFAILFALASGILGNTLYDLIKYLGRYFFNN